MNPLILASTSVYRAELLQKTGIAFTAKKPIFDEDAVKGELLKLNKSPIELAESLSQGKAHSFDSMGKTIIAGDQLVNFDGVVLGKSGHFENAFKQLKSMNGKTHELITAVTILSDDKKFHINHITTLTMKNLSDFEIENYLKKDVPYDCAGSYKIEKSGLILFEDIKTDDFSAIQGLPMIWISKKLKELGYEFFTH
ncbi:MAG: septum formation protein Maf [Bdellovibrio sp.]|nr:septum formation protein Maf [Bdellovibrio sp.]